MAPENAKLRHSVDRGEAGARRGMGLLHLVVSALLFCGASVRASTIVLVRAPAPCA